MASFNHSEERKRSQKFTNTGGYAGRRSIARLLALYAPYLLDGWQFDVALTRWS